MRTILVLVLKDVRRRVAAPSGLLLNLAIPVALAAMLALAFGGAGGTDHPVIRVLILDLDRTPLSNTIAGASQNAEVRRHLDMAVVPDREEGMRRLREEDYAALLVIPGGFTDAMLGSSPVQLELVKNPAQSLMPVVAQQGGEVLALYLSTASRLLGDEAPRIRALFDGEGWGDAAGLSAMITTLNDRVEAADGLLFPPLIEVGTTERPSGTTTGFDFLEWMFPGMIVFGLLFTGLMQMQDLLREQEAGTLRRQLAAPLSAGTVLVAKVLAVACVVAIAHVGLLTIGAVAFGIDWGPMVPLAATSFLLVATVTGFAALVYSMVRTQQQGDAFGTIIVMLMALSGGAFFPPQLLPGWLQTVSRFTVNHWGNAALRALVEGGSPETLGGNLTALALLGTAFIVSGTALLRRRHLRGSV